MGSKLRPLYDKLYIRVEVLLLAMEAAGDGRKAKRAKTLNPLVDTEYDRSIRDFWKPFRVKLPKKYWFHLFCGNDAPFSPKYIPDDMWFRDIVPHYNNLIFAKALQDKCLHNVLFPDIRRPETVVKNIAGVFYDDQLNLLTREEAVARCHNVGRILAKPSVGSGMGNGIRFYDSDRLTDEEIEEIFRLYKENFIVQKKMGQHETLAQFNPNSLNTIRIMTFLFGGKVHILSTILRIGGGKNEVDNVSQGGYQCTIRSDGRLEKYAITKLGGTWKNVDICANGIRFEDVTIPSFDRILEAVRSAAEKQGHFKILGWDIAVAPDGEPVLIEYNVIPGQNQGTCGPTFGDMTGQVLEDVFGRR